jgi:hypothetical protein
MLLKRQDLQKKQSQNKPKLLPGNGSQKRRPREAEYGGAKPRMDQIAPLPPLQMRQVASLSPRTGWILFRLPFLRSTSGPDVLPTECLVTLCDKAGWISHARAI